MNGNPRTLRLGLVLLALLIAAAVVYSPGCRAYPPVTSRESLSAMKLLYSACNTKDPVRLAAAKAKVAESDSAGKLSPAEKAAYTEIIALADAGKWPAAADAAFRMAENQVR